MCAYEHVNLKEYIIEANHLMSVVGFSNVHNVKYKTIFWIFNIVSYYKRKICNIYRLIFSEIFYKWINCFHANFHIFLERFFCSASIGNLRWELKKNKFSIIFSTQSVLAFNPPLDM